jgi:antitoxin (DNA-binding transcriptional repressor) of toxin-antitoxin stability system
MTRQLKLFLLVLLPLSFGSSLPAKAGTFDLLVPIEEHCMAPLTTAEYLDAFEAFMWADPAVSFKTVSGPKWGPCGEFEWKIKWFLTPAPAAEAWIVQHMVFKFNILNCDGTKKATPKDADYYEAWRMGTNGEAKPKYTYDFKGDGTQSTVDYSGDAASDDDWIVPSQPNTKGNWTIDGDAAYQATIKAGEFSTTSGTYAGGLPATTTKPTNLGTTSMHRHADAKWDCCGTTTTTTGTATANNSDNTYTESWVWDGTKVVHTKDGKVVATVTPIGPVTPLSALAALVHSSPAWDGTTFDPGQLIRVANQLQAMGRGGALQALHAYRDELANAPGERTMNTTRIGLLIRVLFLSPVFPRMQVGLGELTDDVAASLPLYPLTLNQDVPLLADPSFILTGKAEDPLRQIEFCELECAFRTTPLTPTADLPRLALQTTSTSAEPRNVSLMQAQVLRLARGVCAAPGLESRELFATPGLSRMLENCMSVFQSGGAVWDPVTNSYRRR